MKKKLTARERVARLQKTLCGKPVDFPGASVCFALTFTCVLKRRHRGPCSAAKVLRRTG